MQTAVLELNDAGLALFTEAGLAASSPGQAVLHQEQLLLGEAARANARRWPGWTNNRFWQQLNLTGLPNATEQLRNHADLVYLQLRELWGRLDEAPDELILAVPGWLEKQQLALLLGIAEELGLPVTGLVNLGLAAVAGKAQAGEVLHLDLEQHQVVLTRLLLDDRLRSGETQLVLDQGSHQLLERWCKTAAERFIQTSRFDPMHDAESEQSLYDQMSAFLQGDPDEQGQVHLVLGERRLETSLGRDALARAAAGFYTGLVQKLRSLLPAHGSPRLHVSHRWRGLPGFAESLSLLSPELVQLEPEAVRQGVLGHLEQIRSVRGRVRLITALKTSSRPPAGVPPSGGAPSHYLIDGIARVLGAGVRLDADLCPCDEADARVTLLRQGREVEALSHGTGVKLNGRQFQRRTLQTGDRIGVGKRELALIQVAG